MPSLLSPITLKALSLFTLLLASFSSAENRQSCLPTGETCDTSGETNYFPSQVSFSASDVVNCDYHNWFKTCTYKDEEDQVWYEYSQVNVYYQCGCPEPTDEQVKAVLPDWAKSQISSPSTNKIAVPVERVGLETTAAIPMIHMLGQLGSIEFTTFDSATAWNTCLAEQLNSGETVYLKKQESAPFYPTATDYNTALTFVDGYLEGKDDLPTPVYIMEWIEGGIDEQAEWIKYVAVPYNLEHKANLVYADIQNQVKCIENNIEVARQLSSTYTSKTVCWGDYMRWGVNAWNVAECKANGNEWNCEIARNLQFNLLNTTSGSVEKDGFTYMTDNEFKEHCQDADVWVIPSVVTNMTNLLQEFPMLNDFKSVRNKQVYDTAGRGQSDWFSTKIMAPDALYEDFMTITKGVNYLDGNGELHSLFFMRDVFENPEPGNFGECPGPTLPRLSDACYSWAEIHGAAEGSFSHPRYLSVVAMVIASFFALV